MYSANLIGKQMDTEFGLYLPEYSIPAPEVQTNYKEIPFRDGAIDKTSPDGVVHYKDREWDLTFKKTGATVSASDLAALSMSVMNSIHGKAGEIIFDDDPNYKWVGRVFVTSVNCENNGLLIVNIHMITHPYKYSLADIVVVDEIQTTSDEYEGSIVSLTGGVGKSITELLVSFSPIQDLHGYANPWPAGGGKQLIPYPYKDTLPVTKTGVTFTDIGNGRIHAQGTATSTVYFTLFGSSSTPIPSWVKPNTTYTLRPQTASSKYFCQFILYGSPAYTATGSTFTTPNDLSEYTGFSLVIGIYNGAEVNDDISPMLEYGSTAHDWSPYANICPISGRTGVSVYDDPIYAGTIEWNQLLQEGNAVASYSKFGLTFTRVDGKMAFHITGTYGYTSGDRNAYIYVPGSAIPIVEGHVYFAAHNSQYANLYMYGASFAGNYTNSSPHGGSIVKATNSANLNLSLHFGSNISNGTVFNETVFINLFDLTEMFGEAKAEEIYALDTQSPRGQGVAWFRNLFPNDWYDYNAGEETCVSAVNGNPYRKVFVEWSAQAGTVYHGTVDPVTGQLTVDRASVLFDGTQTVGLANWRPNSSSVGWLYTPSITPGLLNVEINSSNLQSCGLLSDALETVVYGGSAGVYGSENPCISTVGGASWGIAMRLNDTTLTTAAKINEYLSENPIRVVYKLATPISYQLTPQEVEALVGTNNIWSTGDSVSVTLSTMDKVTLVNHGKPMNPKINVVSEGSISLLFEIDGTRYTAALSAGEYTLPDLVLFDGSTDVYEAGEGTITYTYPEVSL